MFLIVFLIVLLLLLISIYIIYRIIKKEKFIFRFPIIIPTSRFTQYPLLNTSLRKLVLPKKVYTTYITESKIPKFLKYKRSILVRTGNQGLCGSCWAFALVDTLADRLSIYTNRKYRHRLSAQSLISCVDYPNGCLGGELDKAAIWLEVNQYPVPTEKSFKYNNYESLVIDTLCIPKKEIKAGVVVKLKSVETIVTYIDEFEYDKETLDQNIKNMKQELLDNGPFFAAISVYDDFLNYSGNTVYTRQSSTFIGGHAIEIIGYCDKGEDIRDNFINYAYWICRHDWGLSWPSPQSTYGPGTFCIRMGTNECGIESRCGAFNPLIDEKFDIDYQHNRFITFDDYAKSYLKL